jgi:uncharacterized protein YqeY
MSTLKETIHADMTAALKSRNEIELTTLRTTLAEIEKREKAGKTPVVLNDADVISVVKKEVSKRREMAKVFGDAGKADRAEREGAEADILSKYVPAELGRDEVVTIIDSAIANTGATSMREMGAVMKAVNVEVQGRFDGKEISEIVRSRLA